MQGGYTLAIALSVAAFGFSCRFLLYSAAAPNAWLHFLGCGLVGIATAYAFVWIAQYYTDYKFRPVRLVAEASTTGHGTNIIAGGHSLLQDTVTRDLFTNQDLARKSASCNVKLLNGLSSCHVQDAMSLMCSKQYVPLKRLSLVDLTQQMRWSGSPCKILGCCYPLACTASIFVVTSHRDSLVNI